MSDTTNAEYITLYFKCWYCNDFKSIELKVRYDNTIADVKSLLKNNQLIANPEIIVDGEMCPDTCIVHNIVKYNLLIIDRLRDRKSRYRRTFIASALLLTTAFAISKLICNRT